MAKNGNIHPTRIFIEPEELWDVWLKYKDMRKQESRSWPKIQYVGKDGTRVEDYPVLPLTMDGFEVYCHDNHGTVGQYFDNRDGMYSNFLTICSRIKKEIRDHQITGGLLGFYNPSITQRLNGLVEKSSVDIKAEQPLFPDKKD